MDAFITRRGGAGGGLNFRVVGGTAQPENPKENTIWVNTSTEITGWSFSAEAPASPAAGMVWIQTGTDSKTAFNALKKNELNVRPFSVRQYSGGAWTMTAAAIWRNGLWTKIIAMEYLFNSGQTVPWTAYSQKGGCSIGSTTINFTSTVDYRGAWTKNKIDLTAYGKIVAVGSITSVFNSDYNNIPRLMIANSPITDTNQYGPAYKTFTSTGQIRVELDISKISGPYHVEICGSCVGSFYQVYLEG